MGGHPLRLDSWAVFFMGVVVGGLVGAGFGHRVAGGVVLVVAFVLFGYWVAGMGVRDSDD